MEEEVAAKDGGVVEEEVEEGEVEVFVEMLPPNALVPLPNREL